MSFLDRIFDVFSKRTGKRGSIDHEVPQTTRNRVLLRCNEVFSNPGAYSGAGDYREEFLNQVHRRLQYRHGRVQLSENVSYRGSNAEDVVQYLLSCTGPEFLDFIEDIFQVEPFSRVGVSAKEFVEDIRRIFKEDRLPYSLTDLVVEQVRERPGNLPFSGEVYTIKTLAYPKVIMEENEAVYINAVAPALELLTRPHFQQANSEYLAAHEDYRREDYRDTLTKCGSAFESVLKVCFHRKDWTYKETDTAQALVKILLERTNLEPFFEQTLMIVGTLRNRLSSSHGAGIKPKKVSRHIAKYALNMTAAAMLLVAEEMGED